MSGIVGSIRSKSGTIDQLSGGTITSEVIQSPDSLFYIPMQNLVQGGTVFYDREVKMDATGGYCGLRSHLQYRYFTVEFDTLGTSSPDTNHQGFMWGNTSTTTVQGGNSTGHRTTHQSASIHQVRTCNGNSGVGDAWGDFNPADNTWHHYRIQANTNGTTYVYTDGSLRWSGAYQGLGYIGLVGYAGHVRFKNIQLRGWVFS